MRDVKKSFNKGVNIDEISDEKFIEHLKEYKFDSDSKKVILGLLPKSSSPEGN